MVAKAMVVRTGFQAVTARNGLDAIEKARAGEWAAILMDVMMPEVDGLEANREIRKLPGAAGLVTILGVTASAMPLERDACLEAGMNAVLTKPLAFEKLAASLKHALSVVEKQAASAAQAGGTAIIARVPLDSGSLIGHWTADSYTGFEPGSQPHQMFRGDRFVEGMRPKHKLPARHFHATKTAHRPPHP
jgi:CheY-like chemotaxis protein